MLNKINRFIDPLADFAFKKIFGTDPNKDLLISFLNEVLRGRKTIVDLVYNNNEHPGDIKEEGGAIFDLHCTGDNGERFIIEVQRSKQKYFKERALFYTSRLISGQAPKGQRKEWAYQLAEVYLIAVIEGFITDDHLQSKYLHDICLCDIHTGEIFYDKLGYTYIELRNFVKKDTELYTELDKWLYVLKHMSEMDAIPVNLRHTKFEKLFHIAEYSNLTKEEKMSYDNSLKRKWDNKGVLDYAREEGLNKGMAEGLNKGMAEGLNKGMAEGLNKGMAEGLNKGMAEGEHKKAIIIARNMKSEGFAVEMITKITELSPAEITEL